MADEIREAIADAAESFESRKPGFRLTAVEREERDNKFVELYMEAMCSKDLDYASYNAVLRHAYIGSGFSSTDTAIVHAAKNVLARVWPKVEEETRKRLSGGAVLGAQTLIWLCQNSKQDAVRLKAATELLNKGGFAETQKIEIKDAQDLSDAELQQQIKEMMAENGLKVVGE